MAVKWYAHEPDSEAAAQLIDDERRLIAPDLMPVEAVSAWCRKVHRREMDASDVDQAVTDLLALDIEWVPAERLLGRAAQLALRREHSVYDCLYLTLSESRDAQLATADDGLRQLARDLNVALWTPMARA